MGPHVEPQNQERPSEPAPPTQPLSQKTPAIVYIGLVLAFVVPLVGLIISIIALRKVSKAPIGGKGLAVAGTVISGILVTLSLLFAVFLFFVFGFATLSNGAEKAAEPITTGITQQLNGKKICTGGDSGGGLDNTTPWYQAYYEIPNASNASNQIKDIVAQAGYQQVSPRSDVGNYASESMTGHNGGNTLSVDIVKQSPAGVPLFNCRGADSESRPVPTGGAIVSVNMQLPDRNK
jgi:hypothetical protein